MKAIGNLLWVLPLGLIMSIGWVIAGVFMYLIVIGIPWGKSCFVIAKFTLLPFGKEAISRKELTGDPDIGSGAWGTIANILWLPLGICLALGHVISGLIRAITIIGIPFAIQEWKIAGLALAPVGKTIVPKEVAEEARRRNAQDQVDSYRKTGAESSESSESSE